MKPQKAVKTKGSKAKSPVAQAKPAVRKRQRSVDGRKLAEIVAERIENEIIAMGWPVGRVLGSETELLVKHQVSRSVLRQAMRLLEHHQVARMKPGPRSGLIVTKPDAVAARHSLGLYLEYSKVTGKDLLEASRAIETTAVRLAAERITPEGVARLRAVIAEEANMPLDEARRPGEKNIHILLADLTRNPAIRAFVEILMTLHVPHTRYEEEGVRRIQEAHRKIADAVIAGDVAMAVVAMRMHLDELEDTSC